MDLLTILLTCSLYQDTELVLGMAKAFSEGNAYTVQDADAGDSYTDSYDDYSEEETAADVASESTPRTRAEAMQRLKQLIAEESAPVVGLLPVLPAWATMFQRRTEDLFDPCINVSIASAMLVQFHAACGKKASRRCVLGQYEEALGLEYYEEDVVVELESMESAEDARNEVVLKSPMFVATDSTRTWGADRVFFEVADPAASQAEVGVERTAAPVKESTPPSAREQSSAGSPAVADRKRSTKPTTAVPIFGPLIDALNN